MGTERGSVDSMGPTGARQGRTLGNDVVLGLCLAVGGPQRDEHGDDEDQPATGSGRAFCVGWPPLISTFGVVAVVSKVAITLPIPFLAL